MRDLAATVGGFLTPIIAILAAWIAYQQWHVQHSKLRLDLFDRRMRVYEATTALLVVIQREAKSSRPALFAFAAGTANAGFLFGPEIPNYLEELRSKAIEQMQLVERLDAHAYDPDFEERSDLVKRESELLHWLMDQFDSSRIRFDPYLNFSQIRNPARRLVAAS